jgi:hypothetical protein
MHVEIRGQGVELTASALERLGRRLDFALGRLGDDVSRVWVHLAGTRCRMLVRMPHHHDVLVEDQDDDVNRVIERTAHRAGLAARRELSRPLT